MFLQDRDNDNAVPVADALRLLSTRLGLARADSVATLERHWQQLFGVDLAAACRMLTVRDGVMSIEVDDPAVAEHLGWMSADLVSAANDICGGDVISEVRFVVRPRGVAR